MTTAKAITVTKGLSSALLVPDGDIVVSFDELKQWALSRRLMRHVLRHKAARLVTHRVGALAKPLVTGILVRSLTLGSASIEDQNGDSIRLTARTIAILSWRFARDLVRRRDLLRRTSRDVDRRAHELRLPSPKVEPGSTAVYLRTDLWFGIHAGGSIGHIAGVVNNLDRFAGPPVFLTTDTIATVREDIEQHIVLPSREFWDFKELPSIAFNETFNAAAEQALHARRVGFIYQRYSTYNYSGVSLARRLGVPLVLEYNGSEVWVARNWGAPLRYESLAERIEMLNLQSASVVVAVSDAIRSELVARGIPTERILVNPNGVDPQRYRPDIDGSVVRDELRLRDLLVIGFIGTFGPWHGAEVLAQAFVELLSHRPQLHGRVKLLLIGEGMRLGATRSVLERGGALGDAVFTGRIPQKDGPPYLAACDILVSPHVPNADGTPFFGSPTKLFEYMAMGRAIVASDLDQIGEVLRDGETALLTTPGDPRDLARALSELIDSPALRARLGAAARRDAVEHHTWRDHTGRIIQALDAACA